MPPAFANRGVNKLAAPNNLKQTVKELAFYYRNFKSMFIVAIVLSLIAGTASTVGIIMNGFIYAQYIIPSVAIAGNYTEFGLISFL
jgi:hypothetical protein